MTRRGANVSRAALVASPTLRAAGSTRIFSKHAPPAFNLPLTPNAPVIESSCLHVECKLPINLRHFLAEQLGLVVDAGENAIMNVAATADAATLSKIARAIRRYSTARAREEWAECSVDLACLTAPDARTSARATLCLKCARVEIGSSAAGQHQAPACLPVDLSRLKAGDETTPERGLARVQRLIEEFRALRVAFGLPHFELDCY